MIRYRITLTETTDTGPGTVDDVDLRWAAEQCNEDCYLPASLAKAIAAALPKPRIQVRPGMVLRHKSDDTRWFVGQWGSKYDLVSPRSNGSLTPAGVRDLDPVEWEVLLDAEDGAL